MKFDDYLFLAVIAFVTVFGLIVIYFCFRPVKRGHGGKSKSQKFFIGSLDSSGRGYIFDSQEQAVNFLMREGYSPLEIHSIMKNSNSNIKG